MAINYNWRYTTHVQPTESCQSNKPQSTTLIDSAVIGAAGLVENIQLRGDVLLF